jgi:Ca-activated chloride channel family protein
MASTLAFADTNKSLSPYFYVDGDPRIDRLPLKDTKVEITVAGVIADVVVTQTYRNEGRRPINARYIFPASVRAAVYSMRMKIGDDVIIAKIKQKDEAKKEFEEAKKQGKSASLLVQQRPNVFSMNMANLMPGEEIEIELRYTELLVPTKGVYEVVYPTVVGPRYSSEADADAENLKAKYTREGEKPKSTLNIKARVSAGVPIHDLTSPTHEINTKWTGANVAEMNLDGLDPFSGNKDFILRYRLAGNYIESGLLLYEGNEENFFLLMAQPPQKFKPEQIPSREFVFVVDVSGSMEGFPLETSKALLSDLIARLRPTDYFNVILFAGDSTALSEGPMPANRANVERAIQMIDEQRGAGGTELLEAMKKAIDLPRASGISRSIVVITDGYINAEASVYRYIRENISRTNVFSFGIGSSVNRFLIDGIAKAGLGEPFVVTEEAEAGKAAKEFRGYIESPLLTDIRIKPVGFSVYDVFPLRQPDLLAERPLILFGKWRGLPNGTFEISGITGTGEYRTNVDVSGVRPDANNSALRYLWARSRIGELSDFGFGSVSKEDVEEITALGLKYNLLTKYTSFIAVREKVVNPNGSAESVNQELPLPLGVSNMAVGSEPEVMLLISGVLVIFLFVVVAAHRRELYAVAFGGRQRS